MDEERGKAEVTKRQSEQSGKLSEEQILAVVKQLEAARTAAEMAREVGVSTFTIHSGKAKYGGMQPSAATRLHHIEDENSRLKRLVADLSLNQSVEITE